MTSADVELRRQPLFPGLEVVERHESCLELLVQLSELGKDVGLWAHRRGRTGLGRIASFGALGKLGCRSLAARLSRCCF